MTVWGILDVGNVEIKHFLTSRIREMMEGEEWRLHAFIKYGNPHRHLVQSKQRVLGATAHRGCWVDLPKHSHLYTNMTIPVEKLHIKQIKRIKHVTALWFHNGSPKLVRKSSYLCWFPSWAPEPSSRSSVFAASAVSEACFFSTISPRSNIVWSR